MYYWHSNGAPLDELTSRQKEEWKDWEKDMNYTPCYDQVENEYNEEQRLCKKYLDFYGSFPHEMVFVKRA